MPRKVKNRNAGFHCFYQDEELEGKPPRERLDPAELAEIHLKARGQTGSDEEAEAAMAYQDRAPQSLKRFGRGAR